MKAPVALLIGLAVMRLSAGEPSSFSTQSFCMQPDWAAPPEVPILAEGNVHLVPGGIHGGDFGRAYFAVEPIQKIRVEYSDAIRRDGFNGARGYHFLDAPGPGYREQRAKVPIIEAASGNPA